MQYSQNTNFQGSGQEAHYQYQQSGGPQQSQRQRLLVLGGIVIMVIIVIIVFFNVVLGGEDTGPETQLRQVGARQTEIVRLIDEYDKQVRGLEAQNQVARTRALVTANIASLESIGIAPDEAAQLATSDSTVEERLKKAASTTDFDAALTAALESYHAANLTTLRAVQPRFSNPDAATIIDQVIANEAALAE